jgi:hypothetical protein
VVGLVAELLTGAGLSRCDPQPSGYPADAGNVTGILLRAACPAMIEIGVQFQALVNQGLTGAALEIDQHPDAAGRVRAMKHRLGAIRLGHAVGFPWPD